VDKPELSVIIVDYNQRDFILPAVRSIRASAGAVPCEIVIVDNGGSLPIPVELAGEGERVRVLRIDSNAGYAAGCNRGWEAAHGRYLLFLNPDTLVRGDTIPRLVGHLAEHPVVGAVSCRIVDGNGNLVPHLFEFPSPWWSAVYALAALPARWSPLRRLLGRWLIRYRDPFRSGPADWMVGCAVLVRREALEQIGGWDETYFLYAEEIDLYYRLRRAGWAAHYVSEGEIVHYGGASSAPGAEFNILQSYRSRYRFIERYSGPARARVFRWSTAGKQLAAVALDAALWLAGPGGRPGRLRVLRTRVKLIRLSVTGSG